jgi:hypothetical protein
MHRHRPCEEQIAVGCHVPKRDSSARLRCAMLDTERSDDILDGEVLNADEPACVALVPVTQSVHWSRKSAMARPDPSFVTHLIATADQAPQTRSMRRASIEDAQTAYGASQTRRCGVGFRTRQVI